MTKEEFEKEFKVGDGVTGENWNNGHCSSIIAIGSDRFVTDDKEDGVLTHEFTEQAWQKVEPVKKYWKHVCAAIEGQSFQVYISEDKSKDSEYFYLKEPTEIKLDEI